MSGIRRLTIISFIFFLQTLGSSGDVRVGPIYAEKFPALEIVVETPSPVTAQNLTLLEDGKATVAATAVRPFKETGRGMAIAIALDVSGTMAGQPISDMKRALTAFINQVGNQDRIAIVTFADDVRVDAPFGSSPDQLKAAINGLAARGNSTELYKGLFKALSLFDAPELPARKRLVVISDGKDEGVAYKLDDVVERAKSRIIPGDAIGLTKINPSFLNSLERLADLTGGSYARAERSEQLEGIFRDGITRLQSTLAATFTARNLQIDGQEHRVGVRVEAGGRVLSSETKMVFARSDLSTKTSPQASPQLSPQTSPTPAPSPGGFLSRVPVWVLPLAGGLLIGLITMLVFRSRKRAESGYVQSITPEPQPANDLSEFDRPIRPPTEPEQQEEMIYEPWPTPPIVEQVEQSAPVDSVDEQPRPSRRKTQIRTEFAAPEPGRPCAFLIAEEGLFAGKNAPIEIATFWIGSEEENTLCIAEDTHLSGYHACIEFREGTLLLHDNNSTNGTFLNGERVVGVPRPISPGDRVKVGRSVFVITRA